jgi:hypothetical protein
VTVAQGQDGRNLDPGIRLVLEELRDLRREMRDDRRQSEADRRQAEADRRRSDERLERLMQDSAQREATTQKAFRDVRTVGLAIVKTLNRHTTILERIDRKLGVRGNGGPGRGNGRSA